MDMLFEIVTDAGRDTLALVPFLLVTYLVLETLEHMAAGRAASLVRRAGAAGPVVGAVLGVVPQCGFSAMGATLYAGRVVTVGTLVAVFLSTSDEMLPLLVAEHVDALVVARILLVKLAIAAVTGLAIDALVRVLRGNARAHAALRRLARGKASSDGAASAAPAPEPDLLDTLAEAGSGATHIHELCERDHCGCDGPVADALEAGHDGHRHGHGHTHDHNGWRPIVRSALSHTIQVIVFIFLVTFVLVAVLDTVGEDALAQVLASNETLAVFTAGLVGLIPNCAASVVITQLYLEGVLSFGPMLAGSLVGVGVGSLVLFRTNRSLRENVLLMAVLYVVSVAWGFVAMAVGL